MLTTSRYCSRETRDFAKKLAAEESAPYVARGKKTIEDLASLARKAGEDKILIIEEREDRPHNIAEIRVHETGGWVWAGERRCKGF
jgi:rRNA maturation protein Rpf1